MSGRRKIGIISENIKNLFQALSERGRSPTFLQDYQKMDRMARFDREF